MSYSIFNQVKVWTLTRPLQDLDVFLFQSFCHRSAGHFGIIVLLMTQFGLNCSIWLWNILINSSWSTWKQAQIITPPPPCLIVWIRCLVFSKLSLNWMRDFKSHKCYVKLSLDSVAAASLTSFLMSPLLSTKLSFCIKSRSFIILQMFLPKKRF